MSTLVTIHKDDVPLAMVAGAKITYIGGRDKRPRVAGFIAGALIAVKRLARSRGTDPINIMKRLNEIGQVRVVGNMQRLREIDTAEFTPIIAEALGVRITLGPIRVYPNGDVEISNGRDSWQPATDELLQSLDASRMMSQSGVGETVAEMAARLILDWREQRR